MSNKKEVWGVGKLKKLILLIISLVQLFIGILGLWIVLSPNEPITMEIMDKIGAVEIRKLLIIALGYVTLVGLGIFLRSLFKKTTVNQLVIYESKTNHLSVSRSAVEKSLEKAIVSNYDVSNIEVSVKLFKKSKSAKIKLTGIYLEENDIDQLERQIADKLKENLSCMLNIGTKKVFVHLMPYKKGNKLSIV